MLSGILRQVLVVLLLGAPFFFFERRFAAHRLSYRKVLARDVGAVIVVALCGVLSTLALQQLVIMLDVKPVLPRTEALPPWASIPIAIVGADFALYWVHRAIHTRPLWRIHRWHHAPRHMYWLAGMRTSMLQGVVYSIFPLIFLALGVPTGFIAGYAVFATIGNHWMHSNLGFRSRWLEAFLVTPRIHHIHHSTDPRHHGKNFGGLFCVWDRMFGTYFDPDDLRAPLEFGIPEEVSPPRIVLGV